MNRGTSGDRYAALGFSLIGSFLLIFFFAFINFSTGTRFPWFIYPSFAVLWWPLGLLFSHYRSMKIFSLIGSLAVIALLAVTNYLTSWEYPWFLYAAFAVVWWPVVTFYGKNHRRSLSVIGSLFILCFSIVTNLLTSPSYLWFYYPAIAGLWWPLSVFLANPKTYKIYSVAGSLLLLAFFAAENAVHSPSCPWALFTVYPALLWPVCALLGEKAKALPAVSALCLAGIAYYGALNLWVFPGFPWALFPTYALLWGPLAAAFNGRCRSLSFSLCGTILSVIFFIVLNGITTPDIIWAVYPVFALLWWPLSLYFFVYKPRQIQSGG